MNTLPKTISALAAAALLSFQPLSAQSAVTDPVGYVTITGGAGGYIIATPLLKSSVFEAPITADADITLGAEPEDVDTTVLTFAGSLPTLDAQSFVQVKSGTNTGMIVDIASAEVITPVDADPYSEVTLESELPLLAGDVVCIRPHFLVSDLGTEFTIGSAVTVYNSDGGSSASVFFGSWTGESTTPIYPGEGFVLNSTGSFNIVNVGDVSVDEILYSGSSGIVNIVGALSPNSVDASELFDGLPIFSTISVYEPGGNLSSPTIYTKGFGPGGGWAPALSGIDFGSEAAVVVVPAGDAAIPIPATEVGG